MAAAHQSFVLPALVIPRQAAIKLLVDPPRTNDDWFYDFCQANSDCQFERTAEGEILVMAPASIESGHREGRVFAQLDAWALRNRSGVAFNSNVGYLLPSGATLAPDASWVKKWRLAKLTSAERNRFAPICPDFVVEILSPSDRLPKLQAKMEEYRANGVCLGWLIDPRKRKVHVYHAGKDVEIMNNPKRVSGSPELPGFTLQLRRKADSSTRIVGWRERIRGDQLS